MSLLSVRPLRRAVAATVALTVGLTACSSDEDEKTAKACDAFVAIDQAIAINEDLDGAILAMEDFAANAPGDIADDVKPLIELMKSDPGSAEESEELAIAETAADKYAYDSCEGTKLDVVAEDFAYTGVPAQVDAGRVLFRFSNQTQSDEFHEALVLKKPASPEGSAHDLLAAGLDGPVSAEATFAALGEFEMVGAGLFNPEGDTQDVFAVDLAPGEYIVACLLPAGSADKLEAYFGGETVDGPRHFDLGMYAEFTVA